jgi:hypothetical protein
VAIEYPVPIEKVPDKLEEVMFEYISDDVSEDPSLLKTPIAY